MSPHEDQRRKVCNHHNQCPPSVKVAPESGANSFGQSRPLDFKILDELDLITRPIDLYRDTLNYYLNYDLLIIPRTVQHHVVCWV